MEASRRPTEKTRSGWVDAVRGIGIILVFYGHILQNGQVVGNRSAADQFLLIYSFHMPLFFLLAGFFFKPATSARQRIEHLVQRRLVPIGFFTAMLLPLWLWGERHPTVGLGQDVWGMTAQYLHGRPEMNWPTWFLVCLFVCEVIAIFSLGKLRSAAARLAFGVACVIAGVWFCHHSYSAADGIAYRIGRFWFSSEAVVALGCYSIGRAAFPWLRLLDGHRILALLLVAVGAVGLAATYRVNPQAGEAVMMASRRHGAALPFLAAALSGSLAVIAAGMIFAPEWLQWLGRNTLPLVGLNGFFFHYANHHIAAVWRFADSPLGVTVGASVVTAASLVLCVPAVVLMNRYVPQLLGKPAPETKAPSSFVGQSASIRSG